MSDTFKFHIRSVIPSDKEQIKSLYENLFPVKYSDSFYKNLVNQCEVSDEEDPDFSKNEGKRKTKTQCLVATVPSDARVCENMRILDRNECFSEEKQCEGRFDNEYFDVQHRSGIDVEVGSHSVQLDPTYAVSSQENLVGCVVSCFLPTTANPDVHNSLVRDKFTFPQVSYIMTLGTALEYRRCGIGRRLVEDCLQRAKENRYCGAIYLHVITHNKAAIRFYERMNFEWITEIKNYYCIEGQYYNCYVYAKAVNGNVFAQRVGLGTAVNAIVNFVLEVFNGLSSQMGYFSSFVCSH